MSLEEYAEKIGQDLSQRAVALTGLDVLPDVGPVHTARPGPRPGHSIGLLPGDSVTVRPGASTFDPQKGILATRPATSHPRGTQGSAVADKFHQGSKGVGILGDMLAGFDIQNAALGKLDGGRAAAKIGKVTGPLGAVLVPLEHGLAGMGEYKNGARGEDVALGVMGKTTATGVGMAVGAAAGAAAGAFAGPFAPIAIPLLSGVGGKAADYFLKDTSNAALGRKMQQYHNDAWMRSML